MSYLLPHRRETHDRICQRKELLAWEVDFFLSLSREYSWTQLKGFVVGVVFDRRGKGKKTLKRTINYEFGES